MLKFFKRANEEVKSFSKKEKAIIVLLTLYLVIAIAVSVIVITNCTVDFTQAVVLFAITFGVVIVTALFDFFRRYRKYGDDKVTERIVLVLICLLIALIVISWYAVIRYDMMYLLKRFFF